MELMEAIKTRRSIREYKDKPINKEALKKLIDAAGFAPTARGVEPWEFVVVTERGTLRKLGEIAEHGKFIAKAGACVAVFCADTKYYLEDGSCATQNILLAAAAEGIGSCWVAGDKKPYCIEVARLLNAPSSLKLVSLISLGYPEDEHSFKVKEKRKLEEVIRWEKF